MEPEPIMALHIVFRHPTRSHRLLILLKNSYDF